MNDVEATLNTSKRFSPRCPTCSSRDNPPSCFRVSHVRIVLWFLSALSSLRGMTLGETLFSRFLYILSFNFFSCVINATLVYHSCQNRTSYSTAEPRGEGWRPQKQPVGCYVYGGVGKLIESLDVSYWNLMVGWKELMCCRKLVSSVLFCCQIMKMSSM